MNKLIANMIFFRGKLTVNPNTLNNQIHTYFFAHYWQQQHTKQLFIKKQQQWLIRSQQTSSPLRESQQKAKDQLQHSYENWMKLIKRVADFNRFYIQCFEKQNNDPTIQVMDFRAFRLFHDWDVWGDSTSYPQLKATAYFDSFDQVNPPIKPIPQNINQNMYLTTKMGTNKCIIANQDTDSQDMAKLFALNLNLNSKLQLDVHPSVNRFVFFRTVDALPWSPSAGAYWFANGHLKPLHPNICLQTLEEPLKNLLYSDKKILSSNAWVEMKMLNYRYNHPSKVSSVVGYLMNTEENRQGDHSYINKYWRIVKVSLEYQNPNPARIYNNVTNDNTTFEVFLRNVTYGNGKQKGVLVDLSSAILDGNNSQLFPLLPHQLTINISSGISTPWSRCLNLQEVKTLFHQNAGMLLIEKLQLLEGQQIQISLNLKVMSNKSNYTPGASDHDTIEVEAKMKCGVLQNGYEELFTLQIKDKFLKTKEIKNLTGYSSNIDQKSRVYKSFQKSVTYSLYLKNYGKPFTGIKQITLNSYFQVDTSGLTQYTTRKPYLNTVAKLDKTPRERIQKLIEDSAQFRQKYTSYQQISQKVYQGKLDGIIQMTDKYIDKLYSPCKGKLTYTFQKDGKSQEFKLSFAQNKQVFKKTVEFVNGYANVEVFLNENLTQFNNPRYPAMQSLCMVGTFEIQQLNTKTAQPQQKINKAAFQQKEQIKKAETQNNRCDKTLIPEEPSIPEKNAKPSISKQNFTAMFYQNQGKNPYKNIDWLHTVGPKLKLMGLIYPSMQKIIDLYDYDALSMNAMKRAFEIEDQNHSRYMPATREMSSVTHRQIRRWLYNPIYDANIDTYKPPEKNNELIIPNFECGKKTLVQLLKQAFKIQLTTIPLYLSAMYSIKKEGNITKLIRSVVKDEMKHLFIVSNLINALGDTPPYPLPNQNESDYIPQFPLDTYDPKKGLICFNFQNPQNKQWRERMQKIPIQSSIQDQLLRFIMIEMPAQAYEIQIQPWVKSPVQRPGNKCKYMQFKNRDQISEFIDNEYILYKQTFTKEELQEQQTQIQNQKNANQNRYSIMYERIQSFRKAVEAVTRELSYSKPPQKEGQFLTIGMTYEKIMNYLWTLSDISEKDLFNGNNRQQFTYMYLGNMTQIINHRTAMEQIRQIILEGEGSSIFSATGEANTESHFIKFIQIFTGCDLKIQSQYQQVKSLDQKTYKRKAKFEFTPNYKRFPKFPYYTKVSWSKETDDLVDSKVNSQLQYQRLSDRLLKTQFPNTFAPRSFLNGYKKILEEFGFIFRTIPWQTKPGEENRKQFESVRLEKMQNAIAKMRQMSLNASFIVHPNNTFDQKQKTIPPKYPSASPKYNIKESSYLPPPIDPQDKK